MNPTQNFKELLQQIRCFVFDIDGVMTDGSLLVASDGTPLRTMNIKDGYALQLAVKKGYFVFVISGSNPEGVKIRLERLGIEEVHLGVTNKLAKLENLLLKHRVKPEFTLYMGDDMPDLAVMKFCMVRTCPSDAIPQIQQICQYISPAAGGRGCVRDIIEQALTLHGEWE